jgi:hypothetical protein
MGKGVRFGMVHVERKGADFMSCDTTSDTRAVDFDYFEVSILSVTHKHPYVYDSN